MIDPIIQCIVIFKPSSNAFINSVCQSMLCIFLGDMTTADFKSNVALALHPYTIPRLYARVFCSSFVRLDYFARA